MSPAKVDVYKRQDTLVRAKAQGEAYENRIIMCEHPHVYTLGRSGKENNMLLNDDQLKRCV